MAITIEVGRGNRPRVSGQVVELIFGAMKSAGFELESNDLYRQLQRDNRIPGTVSCSRFNPLYWDCMTALSSYVFSHDKCFRTPTSDDHEFFCSYVVGAATVGEAMEKASKLVWALHGESARWSIRESGQEVEWIIGTYRRDQSYATFVIDLLILCFLYKFLSWLTAAPLPSLHLRMAHGQQVSRDVLREIASCPVSFDEDRNSLVFDRRALNNPVVRTHRDLLAIVHEEPFSIMTFPAKFSLADYLGRIFRKAVAEEQPLPSMEYVANLLGLSERTLHRHLAGEGTSYQDVLDESRISSAKKLLAQKELSIDDISFRLSFSVPASFSRAFKNWTGYAPSVYRRRFCSEELDVACPEKLGAA